MCTDKLEVNLDIGNDCLILLILEWLFKLDLKPLIYSMCIKQIDIYIIIDCQILKE